jgi:hypothetical protein
MGSPVTGCVLVLRGGDLLGEGDEVAAGVLDGEFLHATEGRCPGKSSGARRHCLRRANNNSWSGINDRFSAFGNHQLQDGYEEPALHSGVDIRTRINFHLL